MTKPRRPMGPRVVKGRSPKQIAAAKRCSAAMAPLMEKSDVAMPTTSWWVGLDRAALRDQVAEERNRMRFSKYGRLTNPVLAE